MAEVFAGFVCGYALALLSTPPMALALLRLRGRNQLVARLLPSGASTGALAVVLHGALFFGWTGLGIVLGLFLLGMKGAGGALGSPNAPFTLLVAALVLAVLAPPAIAARPLRPALLSIGLLTLLVFGWLMPYMVDWSSF